DAPVCARHREALFVVELPREGLGSSRPGPPPRPYLGHTGAAGCSRFDACAQGCKGVGAGVGSCACNHGAETLSWGGPAVSGVKRLASARSWGSYLGASFRATLGGTRGASR